MKAATNTVRPCLTTLLSILCAGALGKKRKEMPFYNKSCSYGNQDGCLFMGESVVCLAQATVKSTLSACVTFVFDEASANITCDLFVGLS